MAKETYYFSHDYDPTGDPKMQAMVGNYGGLGYGIFWRIVEMLHADECHKIPLKKYIFEAIAKQMLTNAQQVSTFVDDCINTFELFLSDGDYIWSNRVIRNIEKREDVSKVRSKAGKASAEKKRQQMSTLVEQIPTNGQHNPTKERKGKEIKEDNTESAMTEKEFIDFSQRMKADKLFTDPLFTAGVKKEYLDNWIIHFHIQIVGDGKINKDYNEYRKHFKNWLKKQDYCNKPPSLTALDKTKQYNQSTAPPLTVLK